MTKIIKSIPFLTALIIFLGYWNLHVYYAAFNIPIYVFLSTSEIILSFLPIIIQLIIIFLIILTYYAITGIYKNTSVGFPSVADTWMEIKTFFAIIANSNIPFGKKVVQLLKAIGSIIGISVKPFFVIFLIIIFISKRHKIFYEMTLPNIAFSLIVAITIILPWIYKKIAEMLKNLLELDISRFYFPTFILLCYLAINYISNYSKAIRVFDGKPEYTFSFETPQGIIKSCDSLAFIGITSKYIFLRDLDDNYNIIYGMHEITNLALKKNIWPLLDKMPAN